MEGKISQSWTVRVSSKAEKYLHKLSKPIKERCKKELISLCVYEDPRQHPNVEPLLGPLRGFHRLRVGRYRIVFEIIKEGGIIAVVNIAPRGDVYK